MGFFSKETRFCKRCGKQFDSRLNLKYCDECLSYKNSLEKQAEGYLKYSDRISGTDEIEEYEKILNHRNAIVEKYKEYYRKTKDFLFYASQNADSLTDEEKMKTKASVAEMIISPSLEICRSGKVFSFPAYAGVIVDSDDVFAVGMLSGNKLHIEKNETILLAVFTNDPYIPAFPMVFAGKLGFFELTKSKKGRASVEDYAVLSFPNLTYDVQDIRSLKNTISSEPEVKGNLEKEWMLNEIYEAENEKGKYNMKKLAKEQPVLSQLSLDILNEIGFHSREYFFGMFDLSKWANKKKWKGYLDFLYEK